MPALLERWRARAAAALWGFAEATLFFIVPDVLLSGMALRQSWTRVWRACLWATGAALIGGALMFAWGAADADAGLHVLQQVPAISPAMCDGVALQLQRDGLLALFVGALTGTPYKTYAVQAGAQGISLLAFLLISLPARLLRFVAVAGMVALICHRFPALTLRWRVGLWATGWMTFYSWYFWFFG